MINFILKKKEKCKIMKNKKYCIVLIIFSLLLIVSLINIDRNIDSWPDNDKIHLSSNPMEQVLFKVGVQYGPVDLDPQVAWDSSSINVIYQVCEGLFAYNLSDPDMPIIPNLALSGTWNPAGTEYTCILRQGVTFHDGAPFNASAVIFTWDRMSWALNTTGTNTVGVTQVAELYEFPNGTPIVSSITNPTRLCGSLASKRSINLSRYSLLNSYRCLCLSLIILFLYAFLAIVPLVKAQS